MWEVFAAGADKVRQVQGLRTSLRTTLYVLDHMWKNLRISVIKLSSPKLPIKKWKQLR